MPAEELHDTAPLEVADDDRRDVGRLLAYAAADLDRRGYAFAGVVRQAARLLLDVAERPPSDDTCLGCGQALLQPASGRRRKWCGEACRSQARRR